METAKVRADLQIDFSQKIRKWLQEETELAVYLNDDTLILKKITVPKLSSIAERETDGEMPLEGIAEEVHRYRKEKRGK